MTRDICEILRILFRWCLAGEQLVKRKQSGRASLVTGFLREIFIESKICCFPSQFRDERMPPRRRGLYRSSFNVIPSGPSQLRRSRVPVDCERVLQRLTTFTMLADASPSCRLFPIWRALSSGFCFTVAQGGPGN